MKTTAVKTTAVQTTAVKTTAVHLTRLALAAMIALIVLIAPALALGDGAQPAGAASRLHDTVRYNGTTTTLSATRSGQYLTNITATIQLPARYANRMRVVAMLHHNGPPAIRNGWWVQMVDRDTNGDAFLRYRMGSLKVKPGDRVGIWYDDPETVYRAAHPELRVRW
jgi:hypothetical protein